MNRIPNSDLISHTAASQTSNDLLPYESHYANGKVREKGFLLNGVLHGPHVYYYSNGQIEETCSFKFGELDGAYVSYYSSGQLEKKSIFRRGILNGEYEEYDRRGNLLNKGVYHNNHFMSDDEAGKRAEVNIRLEQLNRAEAPTTARRLAKRMAVTHFRTLYPKFRER